MKDLLIAILAGRPAEGKVNGKFVQVHPSSGGKVYVNVVGESRQYVAKENLAEMLSKL